MPSVQTVLFDELPAEQEDRNRRTPPLPEGFETKAPRASGDLFWPASWPAEIFQGGQCQACTVQKFSTEGVQVQLSNPPPVGSEVSIKFPFTVFMTGRVVWRRDNDLGIDFDEDTRRSARIVEDVLLDIQGD